MSLVNVRDFATPDMGDDWGPAFAAAIDAARSGGRAGVLVPADPAPYTVRKPQQPQTPGIDLRQLHGFTLLGEGERSVLAMIGPGSWRLIHIGGQATGIRIRDLTLTGLDLENADQQSHLIVIGTSNTKPGGARDVAITGCTLQHAAGDAVAIVPKASTDPSEDVVGIRIERCRLLRNGRSGVSNQRRGRRVSILHNHFEGNADQDIDFEPTGDLPDSGPSGYLILGNTMQRIGATVSVTLSGTSPESPSERNTFAYNRIDGGRLGLHDARDLAIVGNHIEAGPAQAGTVVLLSGAVERLLMTGNTLVRPPTALPGPLLSVTSERSVRTFGPADVDVAANTLRRTGHGLHTGVGPLRATTAPGPANVLPTGLADGIDYWAIRVDGSRIQLAASHQQAEAGQPVDLLDAGSGEFSLARGAFPRSVSIRGNHLVSHVPLPAGEALVSFTNASVVDFRDNELASFAGSELPIALKFATTAVRKRPLAGWEVVGNRFRGDARQVPEFDEPGTGRFAIAISVAAGRETVRDVRVAGNTFAGCGTQVRLQAEAPGGFGTRPVVTGNMGAGAALVLQGAVSAVLVDGNEQASDQVGPAGARYCGTGAPLFAAPIGSLYSRSDAGPGQLLFINTDGDTTWTPLA